MITTDTGAKKIENTDNWRLIFDAHNDSVDAEDKIVPEMAPIVNGNKSTVGAAIGEYVLVRNSSITGITDGAYTAAKAIPANTTIDSTYLTAVGTGGALNALNSKIDTQTKKAINQASILHNGSSNYTATQYCYFVAIGMTTTKASDVQVYVNSVEVHARDSAGGVYIAFGCGFLKPGDTLSGSCVKKVFALKDY